MIAVVPMITFSAGNGVYIVNETFPVTFTCTATGIPPPEIQWIRRDLLLDPSTNDTVDRRFQLDNHTIATTEGAVSVATRMLTINSAMDSDNGTYTCQATNDAIGGQDQEDFELYVQSKLLFIVLLVATNVHQLNSFFFEFSSANC